jgi:flagellar basal-body rod modification protein FlgD
MASPTGTTLPINSLINQPSSNPPSAQSPAQQLGPQAFLQLLTTELENQDPTQPQDPTQSVTQLAQFAALQSQVQLASEFGSFQSSFGVLQAATLIGKQVTVTTPDAFGNSSTVTGTVATIAVQNGRPYFTMNGNNGQPITGSNGQPLLFSTQQIVGIGS